MKSVMRQRLIERAKWNTLNDNKIEIRAFVEAKKKKIRNTSLTKTILLLMVSDILFSFLKNNRNTLRGYAV